MLRVKDFIKKYNEQLVLEIPELKIDTGIYWVKDLTVQAKHHSSGQ